MNMTPINNAFTYSTTIVTHQLLPIYSSVCIFCNNQDSIALLQDGSFRQCAKCRKQFRPIIQQKKQPVKAQQPPQIKNEPRLFHPFYLPNPTQK